MSTQNRLEEAKSFLARNSVRLALRIVPMALVAVAAAHATTNFSAPNNNTVTACSGGTKTGSLTGVSANGGHGLSVSGNATLSHPISSDCLIMDWQGTGSGTLDTGQVPLLFDYTITPPANVVNTNWTLTIILTNTNNSAAVTTFSCGNPSLPSPSAGLLKESRFGVGGPTGLPCTGVISGRNYNANATQGATLASYEVKLQVFAAWSDNNPTTLTVNVPPASSINLNAPLGALPPSVPALSTFGLVITAIGLIAMVLALEARRRNAGGMAS